MGKELQRRVSWQQEHTSLPTQKWLYCSQLHGNSPLRKDQVTQVDFLKGSRVTEDTQDVWEFIHKRPNLTQKCLIL